MNKRFNRNKISVAVVLATITLATGCGGGGDSSTQTQTNPSETVISKGMTVPDAVAESRARALLSQMTQGQKLAFVHGYGMPNGALGYSYVNYPIDLRPLPESVGFVPGIPELGIPDDNMTDASVGVNAPGLNATSLPATVALASAWDPKLAYDYGVRVGKETRALGFATALGGGINLVRDPRDGRGYEYMGEDPILAGELVAERTIGVQSQQVLSTIKHFAFYQTQTNAVVSDSLIDKQSMHETELLGFEIGITKSNPAYVMCSYNLVNNDYACENEYLLKHVLKGKWGYKGVVQSDWGAQSSTVKAANNGLDQEQPGQPTEDWEVPFKKKIFAGGPWYINKLVAAIDNGEVDRSRLDDMVFRKLRMMIAVGLMDNPPVRGKINETEGNADALRVAEQGMVLLKNDPASLDGKPVLPINKSTVKKILVVGLYADKGVMAGVGSGGSAPLVENPVGECGNMLEPVYPYCPSFIGTPPLEGIKKKFPGASVSYLSGDNATEAAQAAADADVTIIFAGHFEKEGADVKSMALTSPSVDKSGVFKYDQESLITTVSERAKRTVVVLENGQPVTMPWIDHVDAVLESWFPGVQGAYAIANIISGDTNPTGKLPVTFPKSEADLIQPTPPFDMGAFIGWGAVLKPAAPMIKAMVDKVFGAGSYDEFRKVNYHEKQFIGYKWYDGNGIEPLFEFGHGLSYTTYKYSEINVSPVNTNDIKVTFSIENTGSRTGSEIAQVYATLPDNVPGNKQPPKRLVGWSKVELKPGESKTASVIIPHKYISTWDAEIADDWVLTPGDYIFRVSDSSNMNSENTLEASFNIN